MTRKSAPRAMVADKAVIDLPYLGVISNASHDIGEVANRYLPMQGKTVLCIGLSEAEIHSHVAVHQPASVISLTLWDNHIDARTSDFQLVIGDITKKTIFNDDHFDLIVTVSLLEHVNPLRDALLEMRRITKPNGIIANMFGPMWSCAYGHHLYTIDAADPLLNFSLWNMPAYMHLLWSKAEIGKFYASHGYSDEQIETVLHFMFEWDGINRCMNSEYQKCFNELFQIDYVENMYNSPNLDIITLLKKKFPENSDFQTYGSKIILRNSLK
jgi:SAM-dependent methyltransferase